MNTLSRTLRLLPLAAATGAAAAPLPVRIDAGAQRVSIALAA